MKCKRCKRYGIQLVTRVLLTEVGRLFRSMVVGGWKINYESQGAPIQMQRTFKIGHLQKESPVVLNNRVGK